jgi:hypothetical protein
MLALVAAACKATEARAEAISNYLIAFAVVVVAASSASRISSVKLVHPVHSYHDLHDKRVLTWDNYIDALKDHHNITATGHPW